MRIFITGSTGILGRHVYKFLTKFQPDAEIYRNSVDITDAEALSNQISRLGELDLVIHLAAMATVAHVNAEPEKAYNVNVGGTINLMTALVGQKPKFIYCSTGHVYASSENPISEDTPTNPLSLYGRTKRMAEIVATDIAEAHGFELCIPRIFSTHDPNQTDSYLRPNLEKRFANEDLSKPFKLYGANSVRDFLTTEEAARQFVLLSLSHATGLVNVASGEGTSVGDFAQSLSPTPLEIIPLGEPDSLVADIRRLRKFVDVNNNNTEEI